MAKIFISYSNRDKELVKSYTEQLAKNGHQILMDETVVEAGSNFQEELMKALRNADGTIIFLTKNGIESKNVISEVGIARSYFDSPTNKKFLIPLVGPGIRVPYVIEDIMHLQIEDTFAVDVLNRILKTIEEFSQKEEPSIIESDFEKLTINSRGKKVEEIQKALKKIGLFKSATDGIFGRETLAAVRGFQLDYELSQTGEVDEVTYNMISKIASSGRKSKNDSSETDFPNQFVESSSPNDETKIIEKEIKEPGVESSSSADETKTIEKEIKEPEYEFLENEHVKLRIAETNYLLIRIGFARFEHLYEVPTENVFKQVDWNGIIEGLFLPSDLITPEIRILPFVNVPVNNIPFVLKPVVEINSLKQSAEPKGLKLTVDDIFKYQIAMEIMMSEIPSLQVQKLLNNDKYYEGVIFLSEDEYNKIVELGVKSFIGERYNRSSLSEICTDIPSVDIQDDVDFKSDIEALASVIAYKKVEPPLAIGLFGNWGSGKSFFMNKLEKKIKDLARKSDDVYCHEVVHVKFNSWHYSDSNLWASLITKIFEELQKYKEDDTAGLDTLIRNLNSTKELIADSKLKLDRIIKETDELTVRKTKTEEDILEKASQLNTLKLRDIVKIVWENKAVKDNVEETQKLLPVTLIDNIHVVKTKVNELSSFGNQIFESLRIIYKFRKGKKPMALLFAFFVFILLCSLMLFNRDSSIAMFNWISLKSAVFVTALTQFVGFLMPVMGKVNTAYKNLKVIETTYAELEEKEKASYNQELIDLTNQLESKNAELKKQEKEIFNLDQSQKQLNNEIDDIIAGKKLNRFIESKVSDKRYIDSLGIISWIRKDFEELDFLLKIQNEITDEKLKELGRERVQDIFKIDRIILYIDDLDRCNQDIVVRVLEAIHLLLAFPLFVVVVGVDPRWMHNALTLKYKEFLTLDSNGKKKTEPEAETNADLEKEQLFVNNQDLNSKPATSYDYLEKIFQIPFVLKTIDDLGKDNLIMSKFDRKNEATKPAEDKTVQNIEIVKISSASTEDKKAGKKDKLNTGSLSNSVSKIQDSDSATGKNVNEEKNIITGTQNNDEMQVRSELLMVSDAEIDFMKGISFLVGETPRTINRYINIYRIIRTHSKFEFVDNNELAHYCAAMILLGVITCMPESANQFFEKINAEPATTTFGVFIQSYVNSDERKEKLLDTLINRMEKEQSLKNLSSIELEKFKKNLNLISRFTFRNTFI